MMKPEKPTLSRQAAVAGIFYPADALQLKREVEIMLRKNSAGLNIKNPLAILVPHAGYKYSGDVAAAAFARIKSEKKIKTVFLIGRSHHHEFDYAAIFDGNEFLIPGGHIPVDKETSHRLIENTCFAADNNIHANEHSLEVMLPFLQAKLHSSFQICAILIGNESPQLSEKIAKALIPYFNDENLFVFSSDLSHYPGYADAVKCDSAMIDALLGNNLDQFRATRSKIENSATKNLQTSMCGYAAAEVMLNLTKEKSFEFEKVKYANSGDVCGDYDRVVGYASVAVYSTESQPLEPKWQLTNDEKHFLLKLAKESLNISINSRRILLVDEYEVSASCREKRGVFVSLHKKKQLRGCIGTFRSDKPIFENVIEMTRQAALYDPRFEAVGVEELPEIDIEISILTPMQKIDLVSNIEPGHHGIYLKNGSHSATFLPQVATEQNWNREELLKNCCLKAGLDKECWKDMQTDIFVYEVIIIS